MKILLPILLAVISMIPSYAASRDEINAKIDQANELRQKDSRSSIKPLHDIFLEACANSMDEECARALTYIGWALYNCNYPDLAIQVLIYAQSYNTDAANATGDMIAMGLGACYAATGDYSRGEQMLLKSLKQSQNDGKQREQMMIYTYLGDLYSNQAKDSKARNCFEQGCKIAHDINDTIFESALYCNIGTLCPTLQEAETHLFKSIDLSQQIDNKTTECYAYINLAELYLNNHDYAKALRTAEQINRFLPYIDNNDKVIPYYHSLMSQIYAVQADYPSAYNRMTQAFKQQQVDYTQLSKERAEYNAIVIDLVRQSEICKLQLQKQEQQNTFSIMAMVILIVLVVAIVFYVLYRKSRAQHRRLKQQSNEILSLEQTATKHQSEISDTRHTMNYLYGFYRGRNSLLEKLSSMVKDGYKMNSTQIPSHLRIINHTITQCLTNDKEPEWVKRLDDDNEEFVARLLEKYPSLSKNDIMLATFYRLGLSTRDISRLSGKIPTTITTARYRLRTSLNIPEDTDLCEFFNSI